MYALSLVSEVYFFLPKYNELNCCFVMLTPNITEKGCERGKSTNAEMQKRNCKNNNILMLRIMIIFF